MGATKIGLQGGSGGCPRPDKKAMRAKADLYADSQKVQLVMSDIGRSMELVECEQFTCYDFSVLDSDRHVAC